MIFKTPRAGPSRLADVRWGVNGALRPTNFKDVGIFSWCGMRGLATLALALAQRAQAAAIAALRDNDFMKSLPPGRIALVKTNMRRLHAELLDGDLCSVPAAERTRRGHELAIAVQTIAIDAARSEVLSARHEPAADPEVVDKVHRGKFMYLSSVKYKALWNGTGRQTLLPYTVYV